MAGLAINRSIASVSFASCVSERVILVFIEEVGHVS